jgi:hypothetical protein
VRRLTSRISSESYPGYPECVVSCHGAGRFANSIRSFFPTPLPVDPRIDVSCTLTMGTPGGGLHQVVQRRAGGREGRLKVLTHLADLRAHVAFANHIALTVTGQLAGNKDGAPPFHDDVRVEHVPLHETRGERFGLEMVAWHVCLLFPA